MAGGPAHRETTKGFPVITVALFLAVASDKLWAYGQGQPLSQAVIAEGSLEILDRLFLYYATET